MKPVLKIIIPIAIIALAFVGFKILVAMKPKPKTLVPPEITPVVGIVEVAPEDHAPPVRSYGTVGSYFETDLTPQVSGRIMSVSPNFRVGMTVEAGHVLASIDPTDYRAALAMEESNRTVAERTFAEEKIRAEQAAGDWEASGRKLETASDFVLRKPQLAAAQASIDSAKAAIEKARADLERAEIRSPFPAVITARNASPGNQASPQVSLGTLVSTEKVEIRLPLTADQAVRIALPTKATLTSPLKPGVSWEAELLRMDPIVDSRNQVIYAVAEVAEPFASNKEPLPVGIFANASIEAKPIGSSYRVPEAAYVKDRYVWIVNEEEKLAKLEVPRVYGFEGQVYLKAPDGATGSVKVVTRPLSTFKEGVEVKILGEAK
jgi:RND family efflux transporter MFP subunit